MSVMIRLDIWSSRTGVGELEPKREGGPEPALLAELLCWCFLSKKVKPPLPVYGHTE